MRSKRFYVLLDKKSVSDLPTQYCFCEVIDFNTARPFIDFDVNIEPHITIIEEFLVQYFYDNYCSDVRICWKYSENDETREKRWHCVISNIYFHDCWKENCLVMVKYLKQIIPELEVDIGIYRFNSCLRMVGQSKYENERYHKKLEILHNTSSFLNVADILPSLVNKDFSDRKVVAIHSSDDNIGISRTSILPPFRRYSSSLSLQAILEHVPEGLKLDKIIGTLGDVRIVRLLRVRPSYCYLCQRIHEKENSYLVITCDTINLRCFRCNKFS